MCFSATASFTSGVVLTAIGTYTVKKASGKKRAFGAIPFLFGVQQLIEGFVWLSLQHSEWAFLEDPSANAFLFFAQVLWPIYVPWSVWKMEKEPLRRRILLSITLIGAIAGLYLLFCMMANPVKATIVDFHIRYDVIFPGVNLNYEGIPYFLATVVSGFISTVPRMRWFGLSIFITLVVTEFFYHEYLISVWCFFAALASVVIAWIVSFRD